MKKIILITLFVMFANVLFAQDYKPLNDFQNIEEGLIINEYHNANHNLKSPFAGKKFQYFLDKYELPIKHLTIEKYNQDKFQINLYNQTKDELEHINGGYYSLGFIFSYGKYNFEKIENKISNKDITEQLDFFKDFVILETLAYITQIFLK
ncbi:MAG: hypothetical protein LUF90_06095 [Rikenellaceae bacterium]|nr:hypothetical protein [Rikenellaceae bacterium]